MRLPVREYILFALVIPTKSAVVFFESSLLSLDAELEEPELLEELDELELLESLEEELLDGLLELEEPPPAPPPEVLSEDALELLLEEVELLEPLFPPPPPPPPLQAVSMETDTAAASTTAMTLSDNLMINSSHFSESRRETLFSHPFQQHTPPPCHLSTSFSDFGISHKNRSDITSI